VKKGRKLILSCRAIPEEEQRQRLEQIKENLKQGCSFLLIFSVNVSYFEKRSFSSLLSGVVKAHRRYKKT
jgi:hypothetical protein